MMTDSSISLSDLLCNLGMEQGDFLKLSLEWLLNQLMEADVSGLVGAERFERRPERSNRRNGHRSRQLETRLGTVNLEIPKVRKGTYYPGFLDARKRSEKALASVIQEAYITGVSTRKVDNLVKAMGMTGISKSEVSRVCKELDDRVTAFKERRLEGSYPYVWLDAKYLKVREGDHVHSMALVVAIGVRKDGAREVLGFDLGLSEEAEFWKSFLRSLVRRGLSGVRLVISDSHEGLKQAIFTVIQGAAWQRCTTHFMRNVLAQIPKSAKAMAAALIRTIYAQPDKRSAHTQLAEVVTSLRPQFPQAAQILEDAQDDVLAYMSFPTEHWRQIRSTNPLERLNREIGRRADVVSIFPNRAATLRLIGAVLMEQDDEWIAATRRYFSLESMAKLDRPQHDSLPSSTRQPATA